MTVQQTRPAAGTARRLEPQQGEVIDRASTLTFTWNGRPVTAHPGDSIVSALAASGERVFSRSFKYHRPRGLLTASYHDPGCLLQVDDEPNVRAAHRRAEDGMHVSSQNTWPSLQFDVKAVNQLVGRFLAPGFYYKTFIKPERLWPSYEKVLARFAHAGTISAETRHEPVDKRYAHPDVLVAGGGPAGITAAARGRRGRSPRDAGRGGARAGWAPALGRRARARRARRAARCRRRRARHRGAHGLGGARPATTTTGSRSSQRDLPGIPERLVKARAGTLVVAPGLIERPYVFAGNDVPGVMLSTAVRRLINLYAVRPGERAVVLTANADGDAAAEDLRRVGVEVAHVADARRGGDVVRVHGHSGVRAVELADGRKIEADLLVTATGWTAPTALLNQAGDRPVYVPRAARFVPGGDLPDERARRRRHRRRRQPRRSSARTPTRSVARRPRGRCAGGRGSWRPFRPGRPLRPRSIFRRPRSRSCRSTTTRSCSGARTHGMVDFSEDVSSKDIHVAAREGYDSVELVKRYTTVTMGPAQGKLETVNAVAVLAEATGSTIAETGTTTWRPVHVPVTLGALAGRIFEPVRHSPMQASHERLGARPLIAGQWIRPDHYGDPAAEVHAVRNAVGIIDVTPIGKLDLRGPDVPELLNLLYVNKWSKLEVGRVRYGVMCAEDGVVLDDGVTGRLADDRYLMSTTSSGAGAVWEWVENWLQTEPPRETRHSGRCTSRRSRRPTPASTSQAPAHGSSSGGSFRTSTWPRTRSAT